MKSSRVAGFTVVACATALAAACTAGGPESTAPAASASAPPAAAVLTPRVSINQMMVAMVDNAGHVLWDAERQGGAPKDEADWVEIEDHATQLAALGTLIQLGGTGQADMGWIRQVGWKENADQMSSAALSALQAAKSRDLAALAKANGTLVEACEGCHKAFKPQLPSEGIAHQRPHSDSHLGAH